MNFCVLSFFMALDFNGQGRRNDLLREGIVGCRFQEQHMED